MTDWTARARELLASTPGWYSGIFYNAAIDAIATALAQAAQEGAAGPNDVARKALTTIERITGDAALAYALKGRFASACEVEVNGIAQEAIATIATALAQEGAMEKEWSMDPLEHIIYPDLRGIRAISLTHMVMSIIADDLCEHVDNKVRRRISGMLFEAFYNAGVEIIRDDDRASAGLSPRGKKGMTKQELAVLEVKRIEAMLQPLSGSLILNNIVDAKSVATASRASIRAEAFEEAAKVAEGENLLSGSIGPLMDHGWACAQRTIAQVIRALAKSEGK